jgi:hypothetical protein
MAALVFGLGIDPSGRAVCLPLSGHTDYPRHPGRGVSIARATQPAARRCCGSMMSNCSMAASLVPRLRCKSRWSALRKRRLERPSVNCGVSNRNMMQASTLPCQQDLGPVGSWPVARNAPLHLAGSHSRRIPCPATLAYMIAAEGKLSRAPRRFLKMERPSRMIHV